MLKHLSLKEMACFRNSVTAEVRYPVELGIRFNGQSSHSADWDGSTSPWRAKGEGKSDPQLDRRGQNVAWFFLGARKQCGGCITTMVTVSGSYLHLHSGFISNKG